MGLLRDHVSGQRTGEECSVVENVGAGSGAVTEWNGQISGH